MQIILYAYRRAGLSIRAALGKQISLCLDAYDLQRGMDWDAMQEAASSMCHQSGPSSARERERPARDAVHRPA